MNKTLSQRARRARRTRVKIRSNGKFPRLSIYRSSKHIYAQLIDDNKHKTLLAASDLNLKDKKMTKKDKAKQVGLDIAKKITELKIKQVVFDRGYYKYTGRLQELADAVRSTGIKI